MEDIRALHHLSYVCGTTHGLYALIETMERPLVDATSGTRVVVGGTKSLTNNEMQERRRNGMPVAGNNLCLVPIDTLYEPIAAIPDEGGHPGDFVFIRPADDWGYGFTQLIEDNETSELMDLEGRSNSEEDEMDGNQLNQNTSDDSNSEEESEDSSESTM